jgi:hypothetical protein
MQLLIKKTGGFVGVDLEGEVDTAGLNDQEQKLLENLFQRSLNRDFAPEDSDEYRYELSAEGKTVVLSSKQIQAEERVLIRKLEQNLHPL